MMIELRRLGTNRANKALGLGGPRLGKASTRSINQRTVDIMLRGIGGASISEGPRKRMSWGVIWRRWWGNRRINEVPQYHHRLLLQPATINGSFIRHQTLANFDIKHQSDNICTCPFLSRGITVKPLMAAPARKPNKKMVIGNRRSLGQILRNKSTLIDFSSGDGVTNDTTARNTASIAVVNEAVDYDDDDDDNDDDQIVADSSTLENLVNINFLSKSKRKLARKKEDNISKDNTGDDDDNGDIYDAASAAADAASSSLIAKFTSKGTKRARKRKRKRSDKNIYEPHDEYHRCLERYSAGDPTLIRGKLRVTGVAKNRSAFVTCDRGSLESDVYLEGIKHINRAMDGDIVFVELFPRSDLDNVPLTDDSIDLSSAEENELSNDEENDSQVSSRNFSTEVRNFKKSNTNEFTANVNAKNIALDNVGAIINDYVQLSSTDVETNGIDALQGEDEPSSNESFDETETRMWRDDEAQVRLWDPLVNLRKMPKKEPSNLQDQRKGKVVSIQRPKSNKANRTMIGKLQRCHDGEYKFIPQKKALPLFLCPRKTHRLVDESSLDSQNATMTYFRAEYQRGSWGQCDKLPICSKVTPMNLFNNVVEDETQALLSENDVDHGEFPLKVLRDAEEAVRSGWFTEQKSSSPLIFDDSEENVGWKPTDEMLHGRRDYRSHRIFTIDPTNAKDLDDALHITPLPDGRVEIGVHIADVSHFVKPNSVVDEEALRRTTTVYLVDRVIPMLPGPLCEVACSLNENVERLAFSVVWKMNMDGTLPNNEGCEPDEVWYGKTVIKSCARLDYTTAQNIIEGKVAAAESQLDEQLWPKSRRPNGNHTVGQVAKDVRLMHQVAMARRKLRFENGALSFNRAKISFEFDGDPETPTICEPYPIRDSNRLIEEFMLLANYLVAQRLITHAGGRALIRNHSPPKMGGMEDLVDIAKEGFDFDLNTSNSHELQKSLNRFYKECDDSLVLGCMSESLVGFMKPAKYIVAGEEDERNWRHYALNVPYYTHFTSPIRRYADVLAHRLLYATLNNTVDEFPLTQSDIQSASNHCNSKRNGARKAQERSDLVFLSLFVKNNPIDSVLGVCLGVSEKKINVFIPSIGMSTFVYLQDQEDEFDIDEQQTNEGKRKIVLKQKTKKDEPDSIPFGENGEAENLDQEPTTNTGSEDQDNSGNLKDDTTPSIIRTQEKIVSKQQWTSMIIKTFTMLEVACSFRENLPINVKVKVVGPWKK